MNGYKQFCPMAMALEILGKRWTIIILRELHLGSTRFNEIKKGMPLISPTLLSKRLRELEDNSLLKFNKEDKIRKYKLTESGKETFNLILSLGEWGKEWFKEQSIVNNTEPQLLMWDLQRNINIKHLPKRKIVIQFKFNDITKYKNWWIFYDPMNGIDLGMIDTGIDVDAIIESDLQTITAIHMGYKTVKEMVNNRDIDLYGDINITKKAQLWLGKSFFAQSN
jgi:DNA-binding HxlR family transcriptional regulator